MNDRLREHIAEALKEAEGHGAASLRLTSDELRDLASALDEHHDAERRESILNAYRDQIRQLNTVHSWFLSQPTSSQNETTKRNAKAVKLLGWARRRGRRPFNRDHELLVAYAELINPTPGAPSDRDSDGDRVAWVEFKVHEGGVDEYPISVPIHPMDPWEALELLAKKFEVSSAKRVRRYIQVARRRIRKASTMPGEFHLEDQELLSRSSLPYPEQEARPSRKL